MPFCPNCGTEVSEDTRFCPECGVLLVVEQVVKAKNKKKIAGIITACIIAIIIIVVVATHLPTTVEPEPAIPAHYTTYTDELGLFSISYPPEWELDLESIEEIGQFSQEIVDSITSDIPLEDDHIVFMAGLPIAEGYMPNVNIVVEPVHRTMWTHDQIVTAGIEVLKMVASDYHESSRVKTTVDNKTATIIECEITIAGLGKFHYVYMCCVVNNTVWAVSCTALPDDYSEWRDDLNAIVRSLRILK